jgi:hypothetical protein
MMNRQIRRAQAKQDKRADREKEERRATRVRKLEQLRARRAAARAAARERAAARAAGKETPGKAASAAAPSDRSAPRRAGRFSGALMMATVFFIVLQSSVPPEPGGNEVLRSVTGAGFFLLFGYFSVLWLMRRAVPRPLISTWITGALLLVGVEAAKFFQAVVPIDPLMIALAIPGVVGGSYLGRLVYENAPT